jgi:membrane protease YdiL (CAAX protease family)
LLLLSVSPLLALLWAYWLLRRRPSRLLPPQRHRAVPWNGVQVFLLAVATILLCPALADFLLRTTPLLQWLYGDDFFGMLERKEVYAVARYQVWLGVLAFPMRLAAIVAVLRLADARAYQLGWTGRHVGRDVLLGVLTTLAVTPLAQSLNLVIGELWRRVVPELPQHPLAEISRSHPHLIDWALIFLSAVVVAAVLEELLFRAILQSWATSRPHGGDITTGAAVLLAACVVADPVRHASSLREAAIASVTLLFALAMGLVYLVLRWRFRSPTVNGIFGTGLLFGLVHFAAWPTPVPLFLLGVALGLLYYRTQSLLPCVVTHALFNAVSYVELLIQASRHANGQ